MKTWTGQGRLARAVLVTVSCLLGSSAVWSQAAVPRVLAWESVLRGSEEVEMRWPVAVAARSVDEVAVAAAQPPRLVIFRKIGVSWQLHRSVDLPAVPRDVVWVGSRYLVSLRQGGGVLAIEGETLSLRPLSLPEGVVAGPMAASGRREVLLFDDARGRVLAVDEAGRVTRDMAIESTPSTLVATPSGGFYAVFASNARVRRYDVTGTLEAEWTVPGVGPVPAWPVAATVDPGGTLAVVDRHAGRILLFDSEGRLIGSGSRRGREPGLLFYPRGMTRLPDGRLVVADEGNDRAQVFRRTDLTTVQ